MPSSFTMKMQRKSIKMIPGCLRLLNRLVCVGQVLYYDWRCSSLCQGTGWTCWIKGFVHGMKGSWRVEKQHPLFWDNGGWNDWMALWRRWLTMECRATTCIWSHSHGGEIESFFPFPLHLSFSHLIQIVARALPLWLSCCRDTYNLKCPSAFITFSPADLH